MALSVDTGRVVLTETEMQNAVDAASLAASQEIEAAVYDAGQGQGSATIDANSIAVEAARDMAEQVAEANGVYIDPQDDVQFGKRIYSAGDRRMDRPVERHAVQRREGDGPPQRQRPVGARRRVPAGVRLGDRQGQRAAGGVVDGVYRGPRPGARARLVGVDERRQLCSLRRSD